MLVSGVAMERGIKSTSQGWPSSSAEVGRSLGFLCAASLSVNKASLQDKQSLPGDLTAAPKQTVQNLIRRSGPLLGVYPGQV